MSGSLSPLKAIRIKCRECSGKGTKAIRVCSNSDCSLYFYRMGHNPQRKGIGGRARKRSTGDACPKEFLCRVTKPQAEDIERIIREALKRYDAGRIEHGDLDFSTDQRDFVHEAEQELLDCINYCAFQVLRLRRRGNSG